MRYIGIIKSQNISIDTNNYQELIRFLKDNTKNERVKIIKDDGFTTKEFQYYSNGNTLSKIKKPIK